MYLQTITRITTERNDETGELEPRYTQEAYIPQEIEKEDLLKRRALKDHRVVGVRIFELVLDADGRPSVGKEL